MTSFFVAAYHYFSQRRVFFLGLCLGIFALLGYWASRITFEEDIAKLLPSGENTEELSRVMNAVQFTDKTVITVYRDTPDPEALVAYADQLTERLEDEGSKFITKIQGKVHEEDIVDLLDFSKSHLPLLLEPTDYHLLDSLTSQTSIRDRVNVWRGELFSGTQWISNSFFRQDPFGMINMGLKKLQGLQENRNYSLENGYLMNEDRSKLHIFLTPLTASTETQHNEEFIQWLDGTLSILNREFAAQQVKGEYYGATAVAVANAKQIKKDIQRSLSVALVLLIALFIYFYRKIHVPLVVLFPAIFGSLLGLAVLYFLKGTISAISIGIGSVLLGLTLDYSIHILSHYRSTRNIDSLFKSTTKPLIMCAVFTAVDFFCLLFLRSDVLRDLGIFAAVSVLGAALFALIFIPQVYKPSRALENTRNTFIDRWATIDFHKQKGLLIGCAFLILFSLFVFHKVGFNDDLTQLNYQTPELLAAELRLAESQDQAGKALYLVSYGEIENQVLETNRQILETIRLGFAEEILQITSIGDFLLTEDARKEKLDIWNRYWNTEKRHSTLELLRQESSQQGFKANTFDPFQELLSADYTQASLQDDPLIQELFLSEFVSKQGALITVMSALRVDSAAEERLKQLVAQQDNVLIIDRKQIQEQFLGNLEKDFDRLLLLTSLAMFVILFLFFGSMELTLITNIPIFAGWLVTLGVMGVFGVEFNAFNIIITTLIFGLGIDYAIFVTKGLQERFTFGKTDLSAYKAGILMSALTTLLCFGILIFAKHPAIQSIATIPLIGLFVVVMMAFTIQPFLFEFYLINAQEKGNTPRKIWDIIMTIFTFGYFFVGSFILSVFAQILIPILPFRRETKLAGFHKTMQIFFRTLMKGSPFNRLEVVGKDSSHFSKPVIVIANHTSQLDTPTMGMLHEKMLFVVNDRVLNSKFFGRAIRMAGFYSTDQNGSSDKLDQLRQKVEEGYSIIIFPEGTRSRTAEISRFKKGAFLLAEQLKLDILPVMVHGNTDVLPKNDNVLKPGKITVKFLPLIRHQDHSWGENYSQRAKKIGKHFKDEFRKIRRELESPDYFWVKLSANYSFRPAYIRKGVKERFLMYKNVYHQAVRELPLQAKILHLGSGYGLFSFLMAFDSAHREVWAWDSDEEKRLVSQNAYAVNRYKVKFIDEIPVEDPRFDFIVVEGENPITLHEDWQLKWQQPGLKIYKSL